MSSPAVLGSAVQVLVVRTGVANLASVFAGLQRAGGKPQLADDPRAVAAATHVVLPGVGAFGAGMAELRARGLDDALRQRVAADRPTAAVCLGLQLLCATSDETAGVAGLGIVPAHIGRFGPGVRSPQFGWNAVRAGAGCRWLRDGYAYFANSYRLAAAPVGWQVALAEHGGAFVAAMERGQVLACQFHPELSGPYGVALLRRWLHGDSAC